MTTFLTYVVCLLCKISRREQEAGIIISTPGWMDFPISDQVLNIVQICTLYMEVARLISEMVNLCARAVSQIKKVILLHAGSASDSLKKTSHTDEHHHLGVMELSRAAGPPAGCCSFSARVMQYE